MYVQQRSSYYAVMILMLIFSHVYICLCMGMSWHVYWRGVCSGGMLCICKLGVLGGDLCQWGPIQS